MGSTSDEQVASLGVDADSLHHALAARIKGEVRFDRGTRGLYSTDGSNYRQVPIGVVLPRDAEDVLATVQACREHGAPILARGGGTSLAGQCCNVAVVIDMSKYMHRLVELDPDGEVARVEPGLILDDLRAAAEQHNLTFAPDPATHDHCTLGGMIGNNSCGTHSVMGGKTAENIDELDILTYEGLELRVGRTPEDELDQIIKSGGRRGEIYAALKDLRDEYADLIRKRYPPIPRRVSGYNLDQLLPESDFNVARALVGTESTCVVVLSATCRLIHSPPARSLLVLGYPDAYQAADHAAEVVAHGATACEGIDDRLIDYMKKKKIHPEDSELLPPGGGWLLVEFGGDDKTEADGKAHSLMDELERSSSAPSMKLFDDPREESMVWEIRESALGATAFVPGEPVTWEGWEDAAVPPEVLGGYLRDFRSLLERYGFECALYGHYGQGCIHTRIDFDFRSERGVSAYRSFVEDAADLVLGYGGSLSGEHGDGQSRAELLPKMFGPELVDAFRHFKTIWDPEGKMNPGKVVEPYRLTDNLRIGVDYQPPNLDTRFSFAKEGGFANAAERCVGIGKCRRQHAGTMCPSYMVTREEKHSTRGRARLLFEMLRGDPVEGGWRDESVKEALDLCLACKGCRSECPVNVDMATYKAEFLSHYYEGRARPAPAYAMGLIYWWSRLAAAAPALANITTSTPGLRGLVKRLGGLAPQRELPKFASRTFVSWFKRRPATGAPGKRVILWPDTFTNHFHPEVAAAAVNVLESAGCSVTIPHRSLCCGRPLYDYGMLPAAERLLREVLAALRDDITEGTPVIGLEPSCVAVFRDELTNLFPDDELARRLSDQTYTLAEYLEEVGFEPPALHRRAVVHGHCHHKSVMGTAPDQRVLDRMELDYEVLDSGCCGMAGSFGFEADKYDVSIAVGERVLLPAVREAPPDTIILADGFSCREQIAQTTERRALHLAELLKLATDYGPQGSPTRPEDAVTGTDEWQGMDRRTMAVVIAAVMGAAAIARKRSR